MSQSNLKWAGVGSLLGVVLLLASCAQPGVPSSQTTVGPSPTRAGGTRIVAPNPGEAGGIIEDQFTVSATASEVDHATRRITLTAADGQVATFTAPPEIQNFAQISNGDKLSATIAERMEIFVRRNGEDPAVVHMSQLAATPRGAKPGRMVGEAYEVVAIVRAIDHEVRVATLQYLDGTIRTVQVRPDVDLSRYAVQDNVVIRTTATLAMLAKAP